MVAAPRDSESGRELPYDYNETNWELFGTMSSGWDVHKRSLFEDFFGFVEVQVRTINQELTPLHACKKNQRLTFPILENWTTMKLFSEEIKMGLKHNQYEYIFGNGIHFQRGPLLKSFMDEGFKLKADAKAAGHATLANVWKTCINSGYGWWGLNVNDKDGLEFHDPGSPRCLLDDENIISECDHPNYTTIRKFKKLPCKDFNVGVAAAITSWARMRLWNLIIDIEALGGIVAYVDSDSVKTNIDVLNTLSLKNKYMWDGTGDELGSLKNECLEVMEKHVKQGKVELRGAAAKFVVAFWRRRFLLRPKGSLLELEECRRRFAAKRSLHKKRKAEFEYHMKKENNSPYFDRLITYQAKFYSCLRDIGTARCPPRVARLASDYP